MPNRRDFLKLFGVGSTIAPLAAGVLVPDAVARLVEPARVELIEPKLLPPAQLAPEFMPANEAEAISALMADVVDVDMTVTMRRDRIKWHVRGRAHLLEIYSKAELIDVTSWDSPGPWRQFTPGLCTFGWKVEGQFTAIHGAPTISW